MRAPRRVNVVHVDFCINKASSGALELMRGCGGLQWFMILSKKTVRFGHSAYKSWVQTVKHQRSTAKRLCGLWSQCLRVMGSNRCEAPEIHSERLRSLLIVSVYETPVPTL